MDISCADTKSYSLNKLYLELSCKGTVNKKGHNILPNSLLIVEHGQYIGKSLKRARTTVIIYYLRRTSIEVGRSNNTCSHYNVINQEERAKYDSCMHREKGKFILIFQYNRVRQSRYQIDFLLILIHRLDGVLKQI